MVEINFLGLGLGATLALLAAALHFSKGTGWNPAPDITQEVLETRAASVADTDFPEPMNRSIGGGAAAAAIAAGGDGAELEEGGEAEAAETGPWDYTDDEVEYFEVEFTKQGQTIEVPNNKPLLDSGEDAGMDLPYACRQGQCVSCSGKITSGGNAEEYVVHNDQQMLSESEMDDGYTLTCVAYPKAGFTIETGEAP